MERGGETEAKVSLSDTLGYFFWGTLDLDPERFKDVGTADFLTGLMEQHEKAAWMLRSQLETEEEEAS